MAMAQKLNQLKPSVNLGKFFKFDNPALACSLVLGTFACSDALKPILTRMPEWESKVCDV